MGLKQHKYHIPKKRLPPRLYELPQENRGGGWTYLQDGARSHTAGVTLQSLAKLLPIVLKITPLRALISISLKIWAHMDREIRKEKNIADIDDLRKRLGRSGTISS